MSSGSAGLDRGDLMSLFPEPGMGEEGCPSQNHSCVEGDLEASLWKILILLYPSLLAVRD